MTNFIEVWHFDARAESAAWLFMAKPEAVAAAWRDKLYTKVADVATDDLEVAFRLTNNIDTSWSLEPDRRVILAGPVRNFKGHRSSSMGDVFVQGGKAKYVAMFGFEDLDNE